MSYLWENYDVDKEYKLCEKLLTPSLEVTNERANSVNALVRFPEVVDKICKSFDVTSYDQLEIFSENQQWKAVWNCFFHIVANLDRYSGITYTEICMLKHEKDILNEIYGKINREIYLKLNEENRSILLRYMSFERRESLKNDYYLEVLSKIFLVNAYYSDEREKLVIHIHQNKGDIENGNMCTNLEIFELFSYFFEDILLDSKVVWGKPFGIVGNEHTMKIGDIQIIEMT